MLKVKSLVEFGPVDMVFRNSKILKVKSWDIMILEQGLPKPVMDVK